MAIHGPIEEFDDFVLQATDADTPRVEVERHVFVTPNVHEAIVSSKNRVTEWPLLEVSPKLVQVHIFFINLKLLIAGFIKN
jgi:hypothetical protein